MVNQSANLPGFGALVAHMTEIAQAALRGSKAVTRGTITIAGERLIEVIITHPSENKCLRVHLSTKGQEVVSNTWGDPWEGSLTSPKQQTFVCNMSPGALHELLNYICGGELEKAEAAKSPVQKIEFPKITIEELPWLLEHISRSSEE
ncbi:MAG: hypothetical protein A3J55_00140 [Candidatus Ryanbacteria bacterium RIFCSPHIGHO2_02_FULL_45_17b]|nr:MAG: hypothetical protein A3J55_00140 [Candidatus Ryanbacteria bacterium RIFCSPHIGHO2_02_FULL_45_17b]